MKVIDNNLVHVLTIKTSYRSCKIVLQLPTYKRLLNTLSSSKRLYIIKQNYMHIKHPIYSFTLRPRLEFTKPQFGIAKSRLHPAFRTDSRELTTVSTDARLESFFWVTHFKTHFSATSGWHTVSTLLSQKPISLLINSVPYIMTESNCELRRSNSFL